MERNLERRLHLKKLCCNCMPVSLSQTEPNQTKLCTNMTVNGVWCSIASPCIRCMTMKKKEETVMQWQTTRISAPFGARKLIVAAQHVCLYERTTINIRQNTHTYTHSATVFQSMHIDFCASTPPIRFSLASFGCLSFCMRFHSLTSSIAVDGRRSPFVIFVH